MLGDRQSASHGPGLRGPGVPEREEILSRSILELTGRVTLWHLAVNVRLVGTPAYREWSTTPAHERT